MTKKILVVFGTRPEAIKMAPLVKALQAQQAAFQVKVCVISLQRRMLDQVLKLFDIRPDYDMHLMRQEHDLCDIASGVLQGLKSVLALWHPDAMLVHGDSCTTFAASLAAFYQKIPVGHIEAGLRSGNLYAPWPAEAHRKLTTMLTHWHFAPTATSRTNLLHEGVAPGMIHVTGNTAIDALLQVREKIFGNAPLQQKFRRHFSFLEPHKRLVLVTCHRRGNFGQEFESICQALALIAQRHADVQLVYPVQTHPQAQELVRRVLGTITNVHLLEPLDYLPFVYLMGKSSLILTDSCGIQEEAPALGKPVLVLRETTERPEAVQAGTVRLVGTDADEIATQASALLSNAEAYQAMVFAHNPYGDGHACERIARVLRGDKRQFILPPRSATAPAPAASAAPVPATQPTPHGEPPPHVRASPSWQQPSPEH